MKMNKMKGKQNKKLWNSSGKKESFFVCYFSASIGDGGPECKLKLSSLHINHNYVNRLSDMG